MTSLTNGCPPEDASPSDISHNDMLRIKAKEEWLETIPEIVNKTKHPHALQLMSFLASSAAGATHPEGYRALEGKTAGSVCLVPILFQQDQCDPIWQGLIQHNESMAYFILPDIIMLRHTIPCSSLWRGLVLLHEASHAYQHIDSRTKTFVICPKAEEECRVYSFENRLIEMLFGESYNKIIRKATAVLVKEKCVSTQELVIRPGPLEIFTEGLEKLYGPPYSDEEKKLRHTTFVTHAYFSFFTEYHRNDSSYLRKRFAEMVLTPNV